MGIETEYGITVPNAADFNPVLASSLLINSYAAQALRRVRWDYEEESPLRDARGFEPVREAPVPTEEDLGLANVILTNGARYYVDHAHPEFSTPECTNPRQLVVYDKAGERILESSIERATAMMSAGERGRDIPFQVSQRADFFEAEVGLETTLKRPIVNTRDEPHADPEKYRRLHVIIGDANMSEVANFLKTGTTSIVLRMIEDDAILEDFSLDNPVQSLRAISHDPSCTLLVRLKDGRSVRAVDIQWGYFEMAEKYFARHDPDTWTPEIMTRWEAVLEAIERDPLTLEKQVDWVAKFKLL